MQVKINISLKTGVLDPQGRAVENALSGLGFTDASPVSYTHLTLPTILLV